jgi:hypothetical protein
MNTRDFDDYALERGEAFSLAFPALMRKVYVWMAMALCITGLTAYGVASSPNLLLTLYSHHWLIIGLLFAELGLVVAISGAINRLSLTTATLLFILYSALTGVTFSSIFVVYTMSSIGKVFFITAGTFAAMAFVGYTTRRDLSKMGGVLFMALIGLIIATVVNLFIKSSGLDLVLSYIGVLVFVGLTAWDTQKIKVMLAQQYDMSETSQKLALLGALELYLDFINLFLYMLRIFGSRNE